MSLSSSHDAEPETSETKSRRRKSTIWTREKIAKLIELYRDADCLWNHYSELYKNRDVRTKAIEDICAKLGITKYDFGKKVHNLRNQFNSEMKKLERRLEESGGGTLDDKEASPVPGKACRWEHFETLTFLRSVIEPRHPRPGYQAFTPCKKIRTKLEYAEAEAAEPQAAVTSICQFDIDKLIRVDDASEQQLASEAVEKTEAAFNINITNAALPTTACNATTLVQNSNTVRSVDVPPPPPPAIDNARRDQWDAFGELIANEFRNLNSDLSRKKLKRRIMMVMLEVGDEDDAGVNS